MAKKHNNGNDQFEVNWNTTAEGDNKTPTDVDKCGQSVGEYEKATIGLFEVMDDKSAKDLFVELLTAIRTEKTCLQRYADTPKFWEMLASFEAIEKRTEEYVKFFEAKEQNL